MTKRGGINKRHRIRTPEEKETIASMRERGCSYEQISRALGGVSSKAISWYCLRNGIDPPKPPPLRPDHHLRYPTEMKRGNHIVRPYTPAEDAKILELAGQGLGNTAIGRRVGRAPNSVLGRLMTLARRQAREEEDFAHDRVGSDGESEE